MSGPRNPESAGSISPISQTLFLRLRVKIVDHPVLRQLRGHEAWLLLRSWALAKLSDPSGSVPLSVAGLAGRLGDPPGEIVQTLVVLDALGLRDPDGATWSVPNWSVHQTTYGGEEPDVDPALSASQARPTQISGAERANTTRRRRKGSKVSEARTEAPKGKRLSRSEGIGEFEWPVLWQALEEEFGKLTWSKGRYSTETQAVKSIIGSYGQEERPGIDDLVGFLRYKSTTWRPDMAETPLFSKYGHQFGAWYSGGKPEKGDLNGKESRNGSYGNYGSRGRYGGTGAPKSTRGAGSADIWETGHS
jgi:hypothetical protein